MGLDRFYDYWPTVVGRGQRDETSCGAADLLGDAVRIACRPIMYQWEVSVTHFDLFAP